MPTTWPTLFRQAQSLVCCGYSSITGPGLTTTPLSSAYLYNVAGSGTGAALGAAFFATETGTLTDIWFRITAYSGTWASATDQNINYEIREDFNGSNIPGITLTSSGTIALDGTTLGWIKKSGLSVSLTAGKLYWIILGDANGGATNFVTLARANGQAPSSTQSPFTAMLTTANGFQSAGTQTAGGYLVFKQAGNLHSFGNGVDSFSTITSSTLERGIKFQVPAPCTYIGMSIVDTALLKPLTVALHLKLYADGTTLAGSPLLSDFTIPAQAGSGTAPLPVGMILPEVNWVDLFPGRWYRNVIKPGGATTLPRTGAMNGSPDADVLAACLSLGGNSNWTIESSGNWSDPSPALATNISPLLVPGHFANPSFNLGV